MEDENQVFGKGAGTFESNNNLESEDFIFYHQNKESNNNIDNSVKDLTDFIDSLIQDVSDPSEEEINAGIEKILERTHPEQEKPEPVKTDKKKKVTLKVLFIAAVISLISFSCLLAVGNSRNVSIENGFMAFAKETVQIVFFGKEEKEYISVDLLLADLKEHGYKDILFPEIFINESDNYKVSVPVYADDEFKQVTVDIYNGEKIYKFVIHSYNQSQQAFDYFDMDDAKTVTVDDININVFEFDDGGSAMEFVHGSYRYSVHANIPYNEMVSVVQTIK